MGKKEHQGKDRRFLSGIETKKYAFTGGLQVETEQQPVISIRTK